MKRIQLILLIAAMFGVSVAQAASLLDATQMAAMGTDIGDTAEAVGLWLVGIVFTIGGVFFGVNMTKKALGKVGAR